MECYLDEVAEIFSEEEMQMLREVLSCVEEYPSDTLEDVMQGSYEVLLKFQNESNEFKKQKLYENLEREVASSSFFCESISQCDDNIQFATTIEDDNNYAENILRDMLANIDDETILGGEKVRERNIQFAIDTVFYDTSVEEIAEEYGLSPRTVASKTNSVFDYLEDIYWRTYFFHHFSEYRDIKSKLAFQLSCYANCRFSKYSRKEQFAWLYGSNIPPKCRNIFEDISDDIQELEKRVYQKSFTRIG